MAQTLDQCYSQVKKKQIFQHTLLRVTRCDMLSIVSSYVKGNGILIVCLWIRYLLETQQHGAINAYDTMGIGDNNNDGSSVINMYMCVHTRTT